jgi:hypothetical protein
MHLLVFTHILTKCTVQETKPVRYVKFHENGIKCIGLL